MGWKFISNSSPIYSAIYIRYLLFSHLNSWNPYPTRLTVLETWFAQTHAIIQSLCRTMLCSFLNLVRQYINRYSKGKTIIAWPRLMILPIHLWFLLAITAEGRGNLWTLWLCQWADFWNLDTLLLLPIITTSCLWLVFKGPVHRTENIHRSKLDWTSV